MANKKYLYIIIILMIVFLSLNVGKFYNQTRQVTPVWNNYELDYYQMTEESNTGLISRINKIKKTLSPSNLIYNVTGIKPRIPMTYLKREIPFLTFYNPGTLKEPDSKVYKTDNNIEDNSLRQTEDGDSRDRVIRLKFDLSKTSETNRQNMVNEKDLTNRTKKEKINQPQSEDVDIKEKRDKKVVAIYHTHTSETYMDDSRPQDHNGHVMPGKIGNVAQVGRELASILSQRYNFEVIHITRVHDHSYARSYLNSRNTVKEILKKNPNIDLLLDIHRDGIKNARREDVITKINGERAAKVMIVVTNGSFDFAHLDLEDHHKEWQKNLEFARGLANNMNKMYSNLLHRIEIRDTTYNQDLHPHALLLEMGDYRNTTTEALNSARLLADVIAAHLRSQ